MHSTPIRTLPQAKPIELAAFACVTMYVVFFGYSFAAGAWIIDADGRNVLQDFLAFWTAGRQALGGTASQAYDAAAVKAAQEAAIGFPFTGKYPWFYPPFYSFLLVPFALLPYGAAYFAWCVVSLIAYARVVAGIIGERIGYLLALAFPGVVLNTMAGQNGALTAALLGAALALMQRHPVASGVCLGMLTYKPHFGILFPIVLAATGRWRTIAAAAATAFALFALSWFAFGGAAWSGFFASLTTASDVHITAGSVQWYKIQSLYALLRMSGVGQGAALGVHAALFTVIVVVLIRLWRSDASFNLKAAALSVCVPLATPYVMIYDAIILAVPLAFLIREGRERGFLPYEWPLMAITGFAIVLFPTMEIPGGLVAMAMVAAMVARRCLAVRTRVLRRRELEPFSL